MANKVRWIEEKDLSETIETEYYRGFVHTKVFSCPKGQVDLALANELQEGTILPPEWGGPTTPDMKTARLQSAWRAPKDNAQQRIITKWLELQ